MATAATKTRTPASRVRDARVEAGPWDQLLVDLRALSPVGFRIDWNSLRCAQQDSTPSTIRLIARERIHYGESSVYAPPYGQSEALLIELGSRRGQWVLISELREVYRLTSEQIKKSVKRLRRDYPLLDIECRPGIGYRLTGPLPAHVERIASK